MTTTDTQPIRPTQPDAGDTAWFTHDRFGLFIHWGLYSLGARHEWVQSYEQIPPDEYEARYFRRFNPDLYAPRDWAAIAAKAGMKYFVVTTKHHEGFCLWDSALTDYKAPNTPAGRDLLAPMVDAFAEEGLRTGFYHSLIDWHHPHYVIDTHNHPLRNLPEDERRKLNAKRDQMKYADYLHGQVRELLTRYTPDLFWFDFSFPDKDHPEDFSRGKGRSAWRSEALHQLVRELAPNVVLNDRLDLEDCCDVKTPEQVQPRDWPTVHGRRVTWEACQTFSGSWGYHRDELTWRSADQVIRTLIDCVSKGGNLLLNVGPTARGELDERAVSRMEQIGQWMRRHSRAIYGCTQAPADIPTPPDCRLTWNPQTHRLYVHLLAWPYKLLHLENLAGRAEYAQLLHDASEVQFGLGKNDALSLEALDRSVLTLNLPQHRPAVSVPVIEIFLKRS